MFPHRLTDRTEDHPGAGQFRLERGAQGYAVKDHIHRHAARFGVTFNSGQKHLFLQGNPKLGIGRQQLRIHLIQGLRLDGHALGFGVVILVLVVDLGVAHHRPGRLFHLYPAAIGRQTPIQEPLGFLVLGADQTNDILRDTFRRIIHLDVGFPAVLVLAGNGGDGFNRLAVDPVADFQNLGSFQHGCHRLVLLHAARARTLV